MKLNKEQALHCAEVFSDYFANFHRIDDYMRAMKLASMSTRTPALFGCGPEEDLFCDFTLPPEKMNFKLVELPQKNWDIYLNMISSHCNMTSIPGRSLLLAIKETTTDKWCGFIRLGSPFLNCKPRNTYLNGVFSQNEGGYERFNNSVVMGFVIVPAQPFGFNYLGGKLLAAMCCSHEVKRILDKKYGMQTCLFETTSLYGSTKTVSQYDGMKPYLRFKGLTDSDFLPMLHGKHYSDLKEYVEEIIGEPLAPESASSRKLKISNAIIGHIRGGLKNQPELKVFNAAILKAKDLNEQKRYFVSDYGYSNTVDFINGKTDKLVPGENFAKYELNNIIEWWRKKASNRYETLKQDGRLRTEQEVWTGDKVIDIIR